jgi:hypothetical protein
MKDLVVRKQQRVEDLWQLDLLGQQLLQQFRVL